MLPKMGSEKKTCELIVLPIAFNDIESTQQNRAIVWFDLSIKSSSSWYKKELQGHDK